MKRKARVQQWSKSNGFVEVEHGATNGATLGVDMYRANGELLTEEYLASLATTSVDTTQFVTMTQLLAYGGGTVPGANKQVVFNDAGALGAQAGFEYDKSVGTLSLPIGPSVYFGSSDVRIQTQDSTSRGLYIEVNKSGWGLVNASLFVSATQAGFLFEINGPGGNAAMEGRNDGWLSWNSHGIWHAGNDGPGSGLDADTVDGYNIGTSGSAIPLCNTANVFTSSQTIGDGAGSEQLTIDSGAGSVGSLYFDSGSAHRWRIAKNSTAESGSDAGGNLDIIRYSDAGASATAVRITRSNGSAQFFGGIDGTAIGANSASTGVFKAIRSTVTALTISASTVNVDCSLGNFFTLSLTANVTSITFSNLPASGTAQSIAIRIRQDGTGGRTVALPASFKATSGSDTAVQSAANAYTMLALTTFDQGTRWEYTMVAGSA